MIKSDFKQFLKPINMFNYLFETHKLMHVITITSANILSISNKQVAFSCKLYHHDQIQLDIQKH